MLFPLYGPVVLVEVTWPIVLLNFAAASVERDGVRMHSLSARNLQYRNSDNLKIPDTAQQIDFRERHTENLSDMETNIKLAYETVR